MVDGIERKRKEKHFALQVYSIPNAHRHRGVVPHSYRRVCNLESDRALISTSRLKNGPVVFLVISINK